MKAPVYLLLIFLLASCQMEKTTHEYPLGTIAGFAELVAADVKGIALSSVMTRDEMDELLPKAQEIADRYGVSLYRENDLIQTDLFPKDVAQGKEVLLIYKGAIIDAYHDLKKMQQSGQLASEEVARRFGRLLSYPPHKLNILLAEQTDFRAMSHFGIQATNVFLYYRDLEAAKTFYNSTLGLEIVADYGFAATIRLAPHAYAILVDEAIGMHSADEPKTVAIALLTDELPQWYAYLQEQKVPIKYTYKPREGGPHDGFVAIDPEGYLLEFEEFKQHPENEKFMPLLRQYKSLDKVGDGSGPDKTFYAAITWMYYKDMLKTQQFYEEKIGLRQIVDQGWAKVYQASRTGYIGLVDERRGMHTFSQDKAVNVSFILEDVEGWFAYAQDKRPFELRQDSLEIGPEGKYKAFVGYDPEGYYLEFDQFYEHLDNQKLLNQLRQEE
ncbi:MAG: VOC family protein [Cyclobacteriaceae bacterium]